MSTVQSTSLVFKSSFLLIIVFSNTLVIIQPASFSVSDSEAFIIDYRSTYQGL